MKLTYLQKATLFLDGRMYSTDDPETPYVVCSVVDDPAYGQEAAFFEVDVGGVPVGPDGLWLVFEGILEHDKAIEEAGWTLEVPCEA